MASCYARPLSLQRTIKRALINNTVCNFTQIGRSRSGNSRQKLANLPFKTSTCGTLSRKVAGVFRMQKSSFSVIKKRAPQTTYCQRANWGSLASPLGKTVLCDPNWHVNTLLSYLIMLEISHFTATFRLIKLTRQFEIYWQNNYLQPNQLFVT